MTKQGQSFCHQYHLLKFYLQNDHNPLNKYILLDIVMLQLYAYMITSGFIANKDYLAAFTFVKPTWFGVKNSLFIFANYTVS